MTSEAAMGRRCAWRAGVPAWTWHEPDLVLPEDPRFGALGLGPLLERAIDAELPRRGYQRSLRNARYPLRISNRTRRAESLSMASLSLRLLEPDTLHRLWSGFARAEVDPARSEIERREPRAAAVGPLLRDFRPGS